MNSSNMNQNKKKGQTMKINIEFPKKLLEVYNDACKPLCKELKLPQTAFDILMFLANNPQYQTARDIVKIRNIKANLVSVNVDRLVQEGYLIREEVKGDRRKTKLICTKQARPVIKQGQKLQKDFVDQIFANTSQEEKRIFIKVMETMDENLNQILKGGR